MKDLENMTLEELYEERLRILSRVVGTLTIFDEIRQIDKVIKEKKLELTKQETQF